MKVYRLSKPRIKLVEVEIATHCHATEDLEKVKHAILNLLPEDLRKRIDIKYQELRGYYGNPIIRLNITIRGREALDVAKYILSCLPPHDRRYLIYSIDQRYDKHSNKLYIRLNKQDSYLGTPTLYDGSDVIRVVFSFSIVRSEDEVKRLIESLVEEIESASIESRSTNTS